MNFDRKQIMQDAWEAHRISFVVLNRPFTMVGFGLQLKDAWAKAKRYAASATFAEKRAQDMLNAPKPVQKPAPAPTPRRELTPAQIDRLTLLCKDRLSLEELRGMQ